VPEATVRLKLQLHQGCTADLKVLPEDPGGGAMKQRIPLFTLLPALQPLSVPSAVVSL
jgi:hypothetical protein